MVIPEFKIENKRSIRLAECENVPDLMVIAGPNGSGKSTLLDSLRNQPGSNILYVGPHRNPGKQSVQWRNLLQDEIDYRGLLSSQNLPNFAGVRTIDRNRDPWSFDEVGSFLKHSLCQIEFRRSEALTERYDKEGELPPNLPDPWKPLKDLTNNLLPHLKFKEIDHSNRDDVKCYWEVHERGTDVDLDNLSSGEKSIIQIFYPIVEHRIKNILRLIRGEELNQTDNQVCLLVDEPELHLHPNLQEKVFDYFRVLVSDSDTQVIIATHSPTIVSNASHEELYLLRSIELIKEDDNQLIQLADNEDSLNELRNSFGGTHNLTAMQPIVVVEGDKQSNSSSSISDEKLYRVLDEKFNQVTLIPGGGKRECLRLVEVINDTLPNISSDLEAIALLDRDLAMDDGPSQGCLLPVSMVENFILDPEIIWEVLQSVIERTEFQSVIEVEEALDQILDSMREEEIERRVKYQLGTILFRPRSPLDNIEQQLEEFRDDLHQRYNKPNIQDFIKKAEERIVQIQESDERRELYHGKKIVNKFFKRYLHSTGMSKIIFLFEGARHAKHRDSVSTFFDEFFSNKLNLPHNP